MQNRFKEIGKTNEETDAKIQKAFNMLFEGNADIERVCFWKKEFAYIVDIGHQDIRSEGMSYGMFIAAVLQKKELFDALWNFAKTYMQNGAGDHAPYFAWQVGLDFKKMDPGAAPDGEEYFAAALLIAAKIFRENSYKREAEALLASLIHKQTCGKVESIMDKKTGLVRFSPVVGNNFTDPSYHTLAFYRLFAKETGDDFWLFTYKESVEFLKKALHKETGLAADFAEFDGTPKHTDFTPASECFSGDAWRVALNLGLDVSLGSSAEISSFERDAMTKLLRFFNTRRPYLADYKVDGSAYPLPAREATVGLIAMNAAGTLALPEMSALAQPFLEDLWNAEVPTGKWRYYDGLLYMLGLIAVSGSLPLMDA